MANTLVTIDMVTYEASRWFANSLQGVAAFDREYRDDFRSTGGKIGDTLKVRLPQQFEVSEGDALVEQNLRDRYVNLILNRRRHIGMGWSSEEETTDLDAITDRYIRPAAETLASNYDRVAMADVYQSVYNSVGTLGTTPSSALTFLQARARLADNSAPLEMLCAALDPWTNSTLSNAASSLFNPRGKISETWTRGQFAADQLGIAKWVEDQNIPRFTSGACAAASTPVVNGAGQTGSSLVTDGWGAASAPVKGDILTVAGVYGVNAVSKESTGRLQQFVLTATPTAGTDITLSISPSIITSGALQNVTAAPADNAVVTYWSMAAGGTQAATVSPQNLVFAKEAFATVMVDLAMPRGGANASRVSSRDLNIALRLVEQYDINDDKNRSRLDFLAGNAAIRPEWGLRAVA